MSDRFDTDPDDILEPGERREDEQEETGPPRATQPEVQVPEAPSPPDPTSDNTDGESPIADYSDVDPELRNLFWRLVFVIKFALLSLTLGTLFLVFEGDLRLGGQLLGFGLLLSGYGAYRYRVGKARLDAGEFEADEDEQTDAEETDETEKRDDKTAAEGDGDQTAGAER